MFRHWDLFVVERQDDLLAQHPQCFELQEVIACVLGYGNILRFVCLHGEFIVFLNTTCFVL